MLSTGKKVSPTRVESLLTASPLIEQAAVFGEAGRRSWRSSCRPLADWQTTRTNCARNSRRKSSAAWRRRAHEEQVRDFVVLDRPFSIERGELTPKLSLCRDVIARNFAAELADTRHRTQDERSRSREHSSRR